MSEQSVQSQIKLLKGNREFEFVWLIMALYAREMSR